MQYEPTEAELNGLSGDEMAADEVQAAFYEQQEAWEDGEYEQMIFEVEGY